MATNYTMAQVAKIIAEGKDKEAIVDIGRRFPLLLHSVTKITAKAENDFYELAKFFPDYLTANKVNSAMKAALEGGNEDDTDEVESENESEETNEPEKKNSGKKKPVSKGKAHEAAEEEDAGDDVIDNVVWTEDMNAKQLWELLGEHKKRKAAKSTKKADLVEACRKVFGEPKADEAEEDTAEENDDETAENPYEGKSAMELFKECKKRGLKPVSKKPAKFYVELLTKDDEAKSQSADDDEDWDDEEEAEEKPTKKPVKQLVKQPVKQKRRVQRRQNLK